MEKQPAQCSKGFAWIVSSTVTEESRDPTYVGPSTAGSKAFVVRLLGDKLIFTNQPYELRLLSESGTALSIESIIPFKSSVGLGTSFSKGGSIMGSLIAKVSGITGS